MVKIMTHRNQDFQFSKKTGLYLPKDLRKQVDPTLAEKAWQNVRRPIIYGLTALTLGGAFAPSFARADNFCIENTLNSSEGEDLKVSRVRNRFNTDALSLTYDHNVGEDLDEAKLWVNGLAKDGWYMGVLVQGQTDNGNDPYADIGVMVGKRIKGFNYEAFVGPTVQPGVKPAIFYQGALRDTSGNFNLVVPIVDDKTKEFKFSEIDVRPYVTGQIGDFFGGVGTRQEGLDLKRLYGGAGFKNEDLGVINVFNYNAEAKEGWFKFMVGNGNPGGTFSLGTVNLWNDMKGPGMRDMSVPYFTSFLTKGDLTAKFEGDITPEAKDYEAMVGKNLGFARVGAGINYHNEAGETKYGGLIHVVKDINLGKSNALCLEGRYNSRTDAAKAYTRFNWRF